VKEMSLSSLYNYPNIQGTSEAIPASGVTVSAVASRVVPSSADVEAWLAALDGSISTTSVSALPGSPVQGLIYRLTATDSVAKASPGFYRHNGTAWYCLNQESIYDLGDATGAVSLGNIFNVDYKATSIAETTWTFPSVAGEGAIVIKLTNGGDFTQNWDTDVNWPAATAPSLTAAGVDWLVFITEDGSVDWDGTASLLDVR
jgi:hypothetical protein